MTRKSKSPIRTMNQDGSLNIVSVGRGHERWLDFYHKMMSASWPIFVSVLVLAYLLTNLTFALLYYWAGPGALSETSMQSESGRFLDCFFFSVQTLATIGYGKMTPVGPLANSLVTAEALVGMLAIAIGTGLFFARFSKPTARVIYSQSCLISKIDGVPCLMIRLANARLNRIAEARVTVSLLRDEVTSEGERFRNFFPLKLEREVSPVFALSWTIFHEITPDSPLYGMDDHKLRSVHAEFFVSIAGTDETFSQTIHSRYSYTPEDIRWGHYFEDMTKREGDGLVHIDLTKIHHTRKPSEL